MQITIDVSLPLNDRERAVLRLLLGDEDRKAAPAPQKRPQKPVEQPAQPVTHDEVPAPAEAPAEADIGAAVALANELVGQNKTPVVRKALSDLGVKRVSELKGPAIAEFIEKVSA